MVHPCNHINQTKPNQSCAFKGVHVVASLPAMLVLVATSARRVKAVDVCARACFFCSVRRVLGTGARAHIM